MFEARRAPAEIALLHLDVLDLAGLPRELVLLHPDEAPATLLRVVDEVVLVELPRRGDSHIVILVAQSLEAHQGTEDRRHSRLIETVWDAP